MSDSEEKYFVRAFLRFLQKQITEPKFKPDIVESLEVASQCLETAYELADTTDEDENNPLNKVDLFDLFRNACVNVTEDRKAEAENIKNKGNCFMREERFHEAIIAYNRAISLDARNPIFYCNRAAAYSRVGDYEKAANDCKMSLRFDPNYSKAYGRLGIAYSKLDKHDQALEAYQQALRLDPDNVDYQNNMSVTQQRIEELKSTNAQAQHTHATRPTGGEGGAQVNPGGFAFPFDNPALMSLASRLISDPSVINMVSQLSGMENMDNLMETGRNLVNHMRTQNPEVFETIQQQFNNIGNINDALGNSGNSNPPRDQSPPQNPPQ